MDAHTDTSRLRRPIQEMPADIRAALAVRDLTPLYLARPAYQQNDYIGWITRARRSDTRSKRLAQMLDELERGGIYMAMTWRGG